MIKRQRQKCILSLHEPGFPDSGKMTGIGQIYVTMRVFKVCFLRSFWNEDARYVKVTSQKRSLRERKIATHQNKDLFSFLKIPLVPTPPLPLAWVAYDTMTKQISLWLSSIVHLMLPGQFHSPWSPYQCLPNEVSLPIEYGIRTTSFQGTLWEELIFSLF